MYDIYGKGRCLFQMTVSYYHLIVLNLIHDANTKVYAIV